MTAKYTVVFCDDIRQEMNGKHLIVGMYSGDLIPNSVPSSFPLALLVKVHGLSGRHTFEVTLTSPDDGNKAQVGGELDVPESVKAFPLVFVGLPVQVDRYGDVTVDISIDGGKPERIATLGVSKLPQETPS